MKISNAIAIIALGLQGFLLHSTDAASHSPLRLRGGDSAPSDFDIADDPGYYGFDHDHAGADEDYPDQSEFAVNFDEDEAATDFVLEFSSGSGGQFLRLGECAVGIVGRGCGSNAACWRFRTRRSWYGNGVCIPSTNGIPNQCLPSGIWAYSTPAIRIQREHCCNDMSCGHTWRGSVYCRCT